jgi:hypothetical protein
MRVKSSALHPLPTSPIEGEVPLHSFGFISPQLPTGTSPLMGEARRGWGLARGNLQ